MRALILAAGAGTRLRQLTQSRPKCLVPVGGRPFIDHQIDALHHVGVQEIVVVVGFEQQQIRNHLGSSATYVVNEQWETTNSIYSFYQAAEWIDSDRLYLFNCDVLFDGRLLQRLEQTAGSVLAVDTVARREAGEMNVCIGADGLVTEVGKHLDPTATEAVSVQVARFDRAGSRMVRDELARLVKEDVRDAFPTSSYGPLIADGGLRAVDAADLPWAEVDTVEDLEQAEAQVVPRLQSTS